MLKEQLFKRLVKKNFNRAAPHYEQTAILQHQIGLKLLDKLFAIDISPTTIIDIGSRRGCFTAKLMQRYRQATIIALDIAVDMLTFARRRLMDSPPLTICGDFDYLP